MNGQLVRRWIILGTSVVGLALLAVGGAPGASAKDAKPYGDHGSKETFKTECGWMGGTFREDGLGNTECHLADGSWIECDANGDDCWVTPAPWVPQTGVHDPSVGIGGEATTDVGATETPAPVADSPTSPAASQSVTVANDDQDQEQDTGKDKGKKSKKGKKGKGRRK